MTSDDYTAVGGGGLRLKGAKITKKKKKKDKSSLEKNLDTTVTNRSSSPKKDDRDEGDEAPGATKTEAELRYEEFKKKRVCTLSWHV